jgi:hypothetical protein
MLKLPGCACFPRRREKASRRHTFAALAIRPSGLYAAPCGFVRGAPRSNADTGMDCVAHAVRKSARRGHLVAADAEIRRRGSSRLQHSEWS